MIEQDTAHVMELKEGKARFIESWGKLGSSWGISRTMAQLHALLLITPEAICADQIMEELQVSRGNVNMNIRTLCDWGLVHKELKPGDRKEYFVAEKDMTRVMKQIIRHRKQKELDPMKRMLDEISCVENECPESQEFCSRIKELKMYTDKVDKTLERFIDSDSNWIHNILFKVLR